MSDHQFNFIIIGQGLAGSILAHTLIGRGQQVLVIDNNHNASSSSVAAGIINPVTGHRLNLSENFSRYFPIAKDYYQRLEKDTRARLFQPIDQQRLIKNQGQLDYYNKRLEDDAYQGILTRKLDNPDYFTHAEYGAASVSRTAVVDCKNLLSKTRDWLRQNNAYLQAKIDYQAITQNDHLLTVNGLSAKHLIFCEGHQAVNNPWLAHLPFKLAKGEILTIKPDQRNPDKLLNWGNWLVPETNTHLARLGANFIWDDLSLNPNITTQIKLLESLRKHTSISGEVCAHEVGIRPTTRLRKPFIGSITTLDKAYCFNGFGSKGCLLIPFYATIFADHLLNSTPLATELTQCL